LKEKTEPSDTCFSNKWANKLFSYWTYRYVLTKELKIDTLENPVEKFKSKRQPVNNVVKNLLYIFANYEPSNKNILYYIAKDITGRLKMKAYNYIHEERFTLFNYKEIITLYPVATLLKFKKTFNIKDIQKETVNFFKQKVNHILNEDDFAKWNKDAENLIKSPYFEYYKKRVAFARKYRSKSDNFKLKELIKKNPDTILASTSFEKFMRENNLNQATVLDILEVIDVNHISNIDVMPETLADYSPTTIEAFIYSLGAENRKYVKAKDSYLKDCLKAIWEKDTDLFQKLEDEFSKRPKKEIKQ
jgi:hypothetical protein